MNEERMPECIGFIMDGNRRWARARGMATHEGHREGYESLVRVARNLYDAHIPHMACYAFSTENWKRTEEEVSYLMGLLENAIEELPDVFRREGKEVNVRVIGERNRLPQSLTKAIAHLEEENLDNPRLTIWVALSYGGRAEIVDAVNRAIEQGVPVTEDSFGRLLWTAGMPDPDLIVRTSGEQRLSNFLPWQSAYSELLFVDVPWPDFGEREFRSMLEVYATRQRRHGA